jgi:tRNA(Arg) A34 adenosine deaminase TadA
MTAAVLEFGFALPGWCKSGIDWGRPCTSDTGRVALAIELARRNVLEGTGGPFGAAVFSGAGQLLAVGVNSVTRVGCSVLHAEIVALTLAQARMGAFSLRATPPAILAASCDPCAMCLGALLWSGVGRVVCGASREDALAIGFEEGPVTDDSFRYLEARGIEIVRGLLRPTGAGVLAAYRDGGGLVYNG